MKTTAPGRFLTVGLLWLAARALCAASAPGEDVPRLANIVFDEAEYLFESLALARGEDVVFYKGPFVYLVTAVPFLLAPGLFAARLVSLAFDLALVGGFWLAVRRDAPDAAFRGAALLAVCPLSAWFSFHLLTDVPLALFAFLTMHHYSRSEPASSRVAVSVFFVGAVLVKSTALLLLPALLLFTVLQRRSMRDFMAVSAAPAIVHALLALFWDQTPDSHFLSSLPAMSFGCGFFYFAFASCLAAGPALCLAAVSALIGRSSQGWASRGRPWLIGSIVAIGLFYAAFTLFGDPQPKYVMTFVPFLALLAGLSLEKRSLFALAVAGSLVWITPVAGWMDEDAGMVAAASWIGKTGHEEIYTTIPDGVHRHAFAGTLLFTTGQTLVPLESSAMPGGDFVVWTDWLGRPRDLEQVLAGQGRSWRRVDFHANRNERPVYLVGEFDLPPPARTRWEPNALMRPFLTPLDLPVRPLKKMIYDLFLRDGESSP